VCRKGEGIKGIVTILLQPVSSPTTPDTDIKCVKSYKKIALRLKLMYTVSQKTFIFEGVQSSVTKREEVKGAIIFSEIA